MALRKKAVDLGGRTVTIGNALLGPLMDFDEAKEPAARSDATNALVAHALERGGESVSIRDLDVDEFGALLKAVLVWSWSPEEKPPGEPASP